MHTLRNHPSGARYVIVPSNGPLTSVSVWFRSGSRLDPVGQEGLAHMAEHVLATPAILQRFAGIGAEYGAYTALDSLHVRSIQSPDRALAALEEMLTLVRTSARGNVTGEFVESEKRAILEEMAHEQDTTTWQLRIAAHRDQFGAGTVARPVIGSAESVRGLKRADMQHWMRTHMRPERAVVLVVSPLGETSVRKALTKVWGSSGVAAPLLPAVQHEKPPLTAETSVRSGQTVWQALSFPGAPISDRNSRLALDVCASLLASSWSGRLTKALRGHDGLSYWPTAESVNLLGTGYLRATFSTNARHATEALRRAKSEVKALLRTPPTSRELETAKRQASLTTLQRADSADGQLWALGHELVLTSKAHNASDDARAIMKLSNAAILKAMRNALDAENR